MSAFRKRFAALLALACLLIATAAVPLAAESARKLYKMGQSAEAREDYDAAFDYYRQAWIEAPGDSRYKASLERLRPQAAFVHLKQGRKLRDSADYVGAMTEFLKALAIDPSLEVAHQEIENTRRIMAEKSEANPPASDAVAPKADEIAAAEAEAPVELKPISNEPLTLHLNEDSKVVYQTIGKQAGLNVLFDSEYTGKRIQVDLTNTTLYDALRIVGAISGTFWKPITPNTIFVAADTRAKRSALDQQAVRTFYLTNPSQQQDLNDVQTALRNVLGEGPKFFSVPSQNAIVARGTPDQLILAEKIIDDLDKARAEVLLDVSVIEVDKDLLRNIGIQLPGSISLTLQAPNASTTTTGTSAAGSTTSGTDTGSNPTLNDIGRLSAQDFSVSLGTASVNLLLSDSDTKILQDPRIRATDGQKAVLKIGSRIPVATGSYSSGASAAAAISPLVQTQFQYLDIGTDIEVTPTIHFDRDVTLKIKIAVLSENGSTTISGVTEPIIGERSIEHTIRLHEGETSVLGGILERTQSRTIGGTPGVGEIPLLKYLFSSQQNETQTYEIIFLLTPHVIRAHDVSPLNTRMIDTGTGNTIELRRSGPESSDGLDGAAATPVSMPAAKPSPKPLPATPIAPHPATALPQTPPAASEAAPAAAAAPAAITLELTPPPAPEKIGNTFSVAVKMVGGEDVFSVPMELQYDPQKLTLLNVDNGDLLTRDGQIASLVHRDDNGTVHIATSRPQGMKGITGDGTVVVASFLAKAAGPANVTVTQAMPRNSAQQVLPATGASAVIQVQP